MLCSISSACAGTVTFEYKDVAKGTARQTDVAKKSAWGNATVYVFSLGGSAWIYRVRKESASGYFVTEQLRFPTEDKHPLAYNEDGNHKTLGRPEYFYCLNCAHYSKAPLEKAYTRGYFTP